MALNLNEIKQMLDTLSPAGQQEVALLVRRLATEYKGPTISQVERHRILDELCGSISPEEAEELKRITDEEFEVIDEELWR
jgi:hypothetical protein